MNFLDLSLPDPRPGYFPGDPLTVRVRWEIDPEPPRLLLRLFWRTEGRGSTDSAAVEEQTLPQPGSAGERDLTFILPSAPPSFSGSLVSLLWAVEVLAEKTKHQAHVDFVVSPTGEPLLLGEPAEDDPHPLQRLLAAKRPRT